MHRKLLVAFLAISHAFVNIMGFADTYLGKFVGDLSVGHYCAPAPNFQVGSA